MPTVVMVTSQAPLPTSGAALVVRGRLQALRLLGWKVHLVLEGRPRVDPGLDELCDSFEIVEARGDTTAKLTRGLKRLLTEGFVPKWRPATARAVLKAVKTHRPDVVLLDGLPMAEHGRLLRERGFAGRIVLHEHNVEFVLLERQRAHADPGKKLELTWRARRNRIVESSLSRYCDACLALTEEDRVQLQTLNPNFDVRHVPPDVDLSRYAAAPGAGKPDELLFIGSLHWAANLDGLEWFLRQVWPLVRERRPSARLTVVGRGPPDWLSEHEGVTAAGFVDDERPYYERARAVVVPLRFGSGLRIKILTALAMRRAVVSTPLGAEGIPVVSGESILLAQEPGSFADAVVRLLEDPERAESIAERGLEVCRSHYSPQAVAKRLAKSLLPHTR